MGQFKTELDIRPSDDERTSRLLQPLVFQSDELGYDVTVPAGFNTDFASNLKLFWNIIPPMGRYGRGAVVHDFLYQTQTCERAKADAVLMEGMIAGGTPWLTRQTIYHAVRLFGWAAWNSDRKRYLNPKLKSTTV